MSDLEQKFLQEVTDKAAEAKLVCGWDAAHFLAFLQKRGPARAMAGWICRPKRWRPKTTTPTCSTTKR